MRSLWSEPFLWIHLAGVAAVPVFLELCVLGLATGDPVLPFWLEMFLLAGVGVIPVLWMQLSKPFYIFSIIAIAIKPEHLTIDQRRLLKLFKTQESQILAILSSILLVVLLWKLYQIAPIAATATPFPENWRAIGLLVTAIAFLASNLFLQVPLSVARVLLASDATVATIEPYSVEEIQKGFTIPGFQVQQILSLEEIKPATSFHPSVSSSVSSIISSEIESPWDLPEQDTTSSEESS